MRRQEPRHLRSSPVFQTIRAVRPAEHYLAHVLSMSHPLELDPRFEHRLSKTGRWMTFLRWFDVTIRIVYLDQHQRASAIGYLTKDPYRASPRSVFFEDNVGRISGDPRTLFQADTFRLEPRR